MINILAARNHKSEIMEIGIPILGNRWFCAWLLVHFYLNISQGLAEYYGAAEPPVRLIGNQCSGSIEPLWFCLITPHLTGWCWSMPKPHQRGVNHLYKCYSDGYHYNPKSAFFDCFSLSGMVDLKTRTEYSHLWKPWFRNFGNRYSGGGELFNWLVYHLSGIAVLSTPDSLCCAVAGFIIPEYLIGFHQPIIDSVVSFWPDTTDMNAGVFTRTDGSNVIGIISLAASAVHSSLYQYSHRNYYLVCTKVNLKSDFHITGQLMDTNPKFHPFCYIISFVKCCYIIRKRSIGSFQT